MRAMVHAKYRSPEVLYPQEMEKPVPRNGEVLVRVCGAGVNGADYSILTGVPYMVRLGFGLRRPKTGIRGSDVAGIVEAIGPNVIGFGSGDELFGWCKGSSAEYVSVPEGNLATKPPHITFEQAAAVPLDIADNHSFSARRRVLTPRGTLIPNSGEGGRLCGSIGRIIAARLLSLFVSQDLHPFLSLSKQVDLVALKELIESGDVTPLVGRTFPLVEAAAALDYVGQRHAGGKTVITVGGQ